MQVIKIRVFSTIISVFSVLHIPVEVSLLLQVKVVLLYGQDHLMIYNIKNCCFVKQELGEAQRLLEKMKSFEERTFQCLVFYAVGKVYVKENRYRSFSSRQFCVIDSYI